jgi:hypothetical protein
MTRKSRSLREALCELKIRLADGERRLRHRRERFEVLKAIAGLIPSSGDIDGRAKGVLSHSQIAEAARVSGKATTRALSHWRQWRVMRLCWLQGKILDVRFERQVVDALLSTEATAPQRTGELLIAHRRQREAKAPWSGVPKDHAAGQPWGKSQQPKGGTGLMGESN